MAGITAWLNRQIGRFGVDIRYNVTPRRPTCCRNGPTSSWSPGRATNVGEFDGAELAAATWDVLSGRVACGSDILLIDENGSTRAFDARSSPPLGARTCAWRPRSRNRPRVGRDQSRRPIANSTGSASRSRSTQDSSHRQAGNKLLATWSILPAPKGTDVRPADL